NKFFKCSCTSSTLRHSFANSLANKLLFVDIIGQLLFRGIIIQLHVIYYALDNTVIIIMISAVFFISKYTFFNIL
ncbi:hypothetical protein, partial [Anaerobranca gottschalkii]|uniref:hypothetical protein n=1 Tax=Anaerobranca gottschalkii TaxID=108328 RepID=UPI001A9A2D13